MTASCRLLFSYVRVREVSVGQRFVGPFFLRAVKDFIHVGRVVCFFYAIQFRRVDVAKDCFHRFSKDGVVSVF